MRARPGESLHRLVRRCRGAHPLDRAGAARAHHGVRPPRHGQRRPAALLSGDGHPVSTSHRRAHRRRHYSATLAVDAKLALEYLDALKHQRRLSPATLSNYARALDVLLSLREAKPLKEMQPAEVRRYMAMLH